MASIEFVTELARYLPAPIPNSADPDWLFDNIVEEGPAELLYQMTVPMGVLPLNEQRAQRCLKRLQRLRATLSPSKRSTQMEETENWKDSIGRRRKLLEVDLKLEVLDRVVSMYEEYRQ